MEDYSSTPSEVEETPVKRRRWLRGNFLHSWLEHRREDDDDDEEEESTSKKKSKAKKETKDDSQESDWRPERWRDKLRNIFRGLISLEPVPAAAGIGEIKTGQPDQQLEMLEKTAPEQTNDTESTPEPDQPEEETGVLAVSPEAQVRYYGYELMDEPGAEADHDPEENIDTEPELELIDDEELDYDAIEAAGYASAAATTERPTTKSAEPVGEVLRRRQAERLERKVKKLKKQTKTIKREQKEIIDQQKDFVEQLEKQQKAQEQFEKVTVPKMEKARQELHKRLETTPAIKSETPEIKAVIPDRPNQPVEVKSEADESQKIKPEVLQELTKTEHQVKPEELQRDVEIAAEQNVPIESLYERRHEVKDRPDDESVSVGGAAVDPASRGIPPAVPPPLPLSSQSTDKPPAASRPPSKLSINKLDDVYKDAIKTGFWSGIGLVIIFVLFWLLMRL